MKAISQNMMHSSISTTERYIDLPEKELKEKILSLAGNEIRKNTEINDIVDWVADKVIERILGEIKDLKQSWATVGTKWLNNLLQIWTRQDLKARVNTYHPSLSPRLLPRDQAMAVYDSFSPWIPTLRAEGRTCDPGG